MPNFTIAGLFNNRGDKYEEPEDVAKARLEEEARQHKLLLERRKKRQAKKDRKAGKRKKKVKTKSKRLKL